MSLRTLAAIPLVVLAVVASAAPFVPPMPMATYQFGLLRRGPAWTPKRTPATDSLQAGHMANIVRMAEEGFLVAAGPFLDGGDLRGILIFRADSASQVKRLVDRDPAVRAGRLRMELHPWFAPAGVGELYASRSKRPGFRDSMVTLQFGLLKRGPRWTATRTAQGDSLQMEHVGRIFRLIASRDLASAGPLMGSDSLAGVFIFRGDSTRARRLALEDPAIAAGRLAVELHPWACAWGTMPGDTL